MVLLSCLQPPPAVSSAHAVYCLRYPSGYFYAGQSVRVGDRLKEHRRNRGECHEVLLHEACIGVQPVMSPSERLSCACAVSHRS